MSTLTRSGPASASVATPVGASGLQRLRSGWLWLLVVAAVLGLAVVVLWPSGAVGVIDPGSTNPGGGKALAQVLRADGVTVQVVRTRSDLDAAASSPDASSSTLLWVGTPQTLDSTAVESAMPATFADAVYAGLGADQSDQLSLPAPVTSGTAAPAVARECDADVGQAESLPASATVFASTPGWTGCFGSDAAGWTLLQRGHLTLLSDPELWRNDAIVQQDAAALALRLLGRHQHLVWYEPSSTASSGSVTTTYGNSLPRFAGPLATLLAFSAVVTMLWRGRRMGRLVREPLPAEVPSLETTRHRARLYQRTGDRAHVLGILQRATRRRLAARLGVPASDDPGQAAWNLSQAVSRALPPGPTSDSGAVHQLLTDPTTASDADLVARAQALLDLEKRITP